MTCSLLLQVSNTIGWAIISGYPTRKSDKSANGRSLLFVAWLNRRVTEENFNVIVVMILVHRVSKNCAKMFLSQVRQISTNFDNF